MADVAGAALEHLAAEAAAGGWSAVHAAETRAQLAAVDDLVLGAVAACLGEQFELMATLVARIDDEYGRDGVNRAIDVLCAIPTRDLQLRCAPGSGEIVLEAALDPTVTGDQIDILRRSAALAGELLSATITRDGARLAVALTTLSAETVGPALSMLVSYVARIWKSMQEIHTHARVALEAQLCLAREATRPA